MPDRHLGLALVFLLVFGLSLRGITAATTHPDQMALLPLFKTGLQPFNPGWFEKPPFHTYTNYFLAVLPASGIASALDLSTADRERLLLVWSRLVSISLFLAAAGLFYVTVRRAFGAFSANVLTALLASSAGLIAHVHFLTADIPVMAWMLAAFHFSHRVLVGGRLSDYLFAGLFTGIATATKYNGLAIGVAFVAAHYLRHYYLQKRPFRWMDCVFPAKLVAGVALVVLGFVFANPFSIIDRRTFVYDFVHNYKVAFVYEGQTGSSYGAFFLAIIEVVGVPGFVVLVAGWIGSLILALTGRVGPMQKAAMAMAVVVVVLYYVKFAPAPRLETRFVLPIVPFVALVPALAVERIRRLRRPFIVAAMLILGYNAACAFVTGGRFNQDPRLAAADWLRENIPPGSVVETDIYAPSWLEGSAEAVKIVEMPFVSGRERLFKHLFKDDPFVVGTPDYYQEVDEMVLWYSARALAARNPDFIVIDALYYERFTSSGPRQALYPSMQRFFGDLMEERLGYRIVFDRTTAPVPAWVYPKKPDFQQNRITVLARAAMVGGHRVSPFRRTLTLAFLTPERTRGRVRKVAAPSC
jgi:hypothetical protein